MRDLYTKALVPRAKAMRREMTAPERKLWFLFLRSHPARFRRQVPLQGYILDFYAPSFKLCIELDGRSHDGLEAQAYDAVRTKVLSGADIKVLRFSNSDVLYTFTGVCKAIDEEIKSLNVSE